MSVIGKVDYSDRALVTVGREFKTSNEYQLKVGTACVFGEVLKLDGGFLAPVAAITDDAFTIAYQDVDATSAAKNINYMQSATVIESKVVCAIGVIADYKESLQGYGISTKKEK